ncbi:bifunctional diguanylate cyclase/phosphodiesterase [Paenisporosarcina antarctica]|uniref:EAL domain-containing protein n=1 Tax=Paenisporosarcina antarctica TaxID=417367 RepID=A0A4P6ZUE9_9BACL|nr:EAL domain-containing protein [Paenisporosarcina antarctica]QBP39992.1 EAL domain-containing protein [Paenisporosarcina antarctica]
MSKRQLQTYILLSIVLMTVVAITIINYQYTKKYVLETVEKETKELLNNFTDETNKFSNERVVELKLIADYLLLLDGEDEDVIKFLNKQSENMPFFTSLGFINPQGKILAGDGSAFPVNQPESFARALQGEIVFSDLFPLYQDSNQIVTAIRVPVGQNEEIIGVISGVVNMGNILGAIAKKSSLPGTLYLYKEDQLVFSTTDETLEEKVPNAKQLVNEMQVKENGSKMVNHKTGHYVMYQRAGEDWTVLVDSFSNDLESHISSIFWRNILIVVLTFLILCGVSIYIRRNDVREDKMLKRDLLTNLPNRVLFEEKLTKDLDPTSFKNFSLLFINLDRFKDINERIGYQLGDRVLFELSNKIQAFANRNELYRVGGDEFVIIVPSNSEEELESLTARLIKLMEEPVEVSSFESIWITLSLGIRKSVLGDWPDLMMQDATFAVQEAKKQGGNRAVFFSQELANQNERARLIANNLVQALYNNEYYMVYQPVYDLSNQKITSYEALIRWESPLIGSISPVEFIPLLEDSDLIVPVGRWILRQVALQVKLWELEGYNGFQVAINISVKQMMHREFLNDVKSIIQEAKISPRRLIFEITETVAVQNSELATQILSDLNHLGVKTALDDFGTGYSSLSILKLLPIQQVKVDRMFIMEMEQEDNKSLVILQGIIDIAKNLGMSTVMEGVETSEQLELLKNMGAQKIQGYLISRPIVAELAIELQKNTWKY